MALFICSLAVRAKNIPIGCCVLDVEDPEEIPGIMEELCSQLVADILGDGQSLDLSAFPLCPEHHDFKKLETGRFYTTVEMTKLGYGNDYGKRKDVEELYANTSSTSRYERHRRGSTN